MNMSFYTGAVGAGGHQFKLDILSNNMANLGTVGYKAKKPVFSELLYTNINAPADEQTNLVAGSGMRVEKGDTYFAQGAFLETGADLNFAINGPGFFALMNPENGEVVYTRDGSFMMSEFNDQFYLCSNDGYRVLDPNGEPIIITDSKDNVTLGIFDFAQKNGMQSFMHNKYVPVEKNGPPIPVELTDNKVRRGFLEASNIDMAYEFSKIIETQRAYQYALKMVQTSDEIEQTINSLRQ